MESVMELRRYFEILCRRGSIIAVIAVLAMGGVVIQLAMRPAQYVGEVSMLVTPQSISPAGRGLELGSQDLSAFQSDYHDTVLSNIIYLMNSRVVLRRAAERLGTDPGLLYKRVAIKKVRGTDVLTVTAKDSDPDRAALFANTVAQEFGDYYSQINRSEATSARKFIEGQLSLTKDRLTQAEGDLQVFKSRTGSVGLSDQISKMVTRALDVQAQYDTATLEEKAARARSEAIQSRLGSQNDQLARLSVETNPVFAKLRDSLTNLEVELASMRQAYTDQHPKVQAQVGKIAQVKKQMSEEAQRVVSGRSLSVSPVREQLIRDLTNAQFEADVARAKATGVNQILAKMQIGLSGIPANELNLARLQRNVKVQEDTYLRLSSLYEDSLIKEKQAGASGQAAVIVVDPAVSPVMPESKHLPMMALFAGLLGVIAGSAVALLVDGLDDSVRSTHQAEGAYGVPVLAAIPTMNTRNYRHLSGAPAITTVSMPVVVAIGLGVTAALLSLYFAHTGAVSDKAAFLGRLFEVFQTVR